MPAPREGEHALGAANSCAKRARGALTDRSYLKRSTTAAPILGPFGWRSLLVDASTRGGKASAERPDLPGQVMVSSIRVVQGHVLPVLSVMGDLLVMNCALASTPPTDCVVPPSVQWLASAHAHGVADAVELATDSR